MAERTHCGQSPKASRRSTCQHSTSILPGLTQGFVSEKGEKGTMLTPFSPAPLPLGAVVSRRRLPKHRWQNRVCAPRAGWILPTSSQPPSLRASVVNPHPAIPTPPAQKIHHRDTEAQRRCGGGSRTGPPMGMASPVRSHFYLEVPEQRTDFSCRRLEMPKPSSYSPNTVVRIQSARPAQAGFCQPPPDLSVSEPPW